MDKTLMYTIRANKWIDFSATYVITNSTGIEIGRVSRKGMRSLWKATYLIYDNNLQHVFTIKEDNAWIKVIDAIFSEIPILGMFTGYFFNPKFSVYNQTGSERKYALKKKPSFFGRYFYLDKVEISAENDELVTLGCMMMILLERRRG